MKKRLLLGLMATSMAMTGFALGQGEYVYTPQGRFVITGSNQNANNSFADFTGWTVVSAAGNTIDANFVINTDGYAAGLNSVQSQNATAGEGISYQFSSSGGTYVVSYKIKAPSAPISIRTRKVDDTTSLGNVVRIDDGTDDAVFNTADELSTEWKTFNYAIEESGTYYISFTGMTAGVEIADLQIAQAKKVADLRQRDAALDLVKAYDAIYSSDGSKETIEKLEDMSDATSQIDLDNEIEGVEDILDEIREEGGLEDYLAGNNTNYFNIDKWPSKIQKADKLGDWTAYPGGRGFWENNGTYPDLGHYQRGSTWCGGSPTSPMGVTLQKELMTGSYVFAIDANAAVRENVKDTWTNDDGMQPAYGVAYVVNVTTGDTIKSVVKDLHPVNYTQFVVFAEIAADGTYEFGFKAYCKETHQTLSYGSVVYVKDASIWGKNNSLYSQAQLAYEADVREQIATCHTNIETANTNLSNASMLWGKSVLQAAVSAAQSAIQQYDAMSQDAIIATYDKAAYNHDNRTKTYEEGLLVYEVYNNAVKDIIAANRTFTAVNDTLNSIQVAITAAETTLNQRVYDSATGKAELQAAIETAKGVQAQMQAADYSEENAATIVAAIKTLNEAIATFMASIPASSITEIISLDFENGATLNSSTGAYEIAGNNTVMTIENFSFTTPIGDNASDKDDNGNPKDTGNYPFELGYDLNGEKLLPGVLRVGNGSGVATIPAKDYGTNILKVSMDMWYVRLSGKYIGFNLTDEAGERVAGWYMSAYDGAYGSGYDDFRLDAQDSDGENGYIKDFFVANTTGNNGSCADDNLTHIECFFDYGEKSMYLVTTTPGGNTHTSAKVAFNGLVPTAFTVLSNDNTYNGRRSWFDNLKIEQIAAGPADGFVDGIEEVNTAEQNVAPVKKVIKDGRIVINGKYGLNGIVIK